MELQSFVSAVGAVEKLFQVPVAEGIQLILQEVAIKRLGAQKAMFCRAEESVKGKRLYVLGAAVADEELSGVEVSELQVDGLIDSAVVTMPVTTDQRVGPEDSMELSTEQNVVVLFPRSGARFTIEEAEEAAHAITTLVNAARRFHGYKRKAQADPLTGLPNVRMYQRQLERIARLLITDHGNCGFTHHVVTILSMDIDNFKAFNEAGGYEAGDNALRGVAATLVSVQESFDQHFDELYIGRRHGDEFYAIIVAREEIQQERFAQAIIERQRENAVTISCGVVTVHGGLVELINYASSIHLQLPAVSRMTWFEIEEVAATRRLSLAATRAVASLLKAVADHALLTYAKQEKDTVAFIRIPHDG